MKHVFLAAGGLLLMTGSAMAGWYRIENFVGSIGAAPVHLSLQMYEFGSGLTVKGSYYFDNERIPIAVYGANDGLAVKLCEIGSPEQFNEVMIQGSTSPIDISGCPFSLVLDAAGASGSRHDAPVVLTRVARLDETGPAEVDGIVEIPFWHQMDRHMLVGRYAKFDDRVCLESMHLIEKRSGAIDQDIAFDTGRCDAGTVMTPIYMNVEGYTDPSAEVVFVNVQDGRAGTTIDYIVDRQTGLLSEQ